jgi:hypothetical protein
MNPEWDGAISPAMKTPEEQAEMTVRMALVKACLLPRGVFRPTTRTTPDAVPPGRSRAPVTRSSVLARLAEALARDLARACAGADGTPGGGAWTAGHASRVAEVLTAIAGSGLPFEERRAAALHLLETFARLRSTREGGTTAPAASPGPAPGPIPVQSSPGPSTRKEDAAPGSKSLGGRTEVSFGDAGGSQAEKQDRGGAS